MPALPAHQASTARGDRLGGDVLGAVLLGIGLWALAGALRKPIGLYDEGIPLTDAQLLLAGRVPFRDFYSNYPPGVFLLLAAAFRLLGTSVLVERGVGLVLHLGVAAAAGRVAGRLRGRPFDLLASGLVLLWLSRIGDTAYAWLAALAVALAFSARWISSAQSPGGATFAATGITLGAVSWFRHDLAAYLALAVTAVLSADLLLARWSGRSGAISRRSAAGLLLGALGAAATFWSLWLWLAGPARILGDLVVEQARHVQPSRVLPLPPLFSLTRAEAISLRLPAFLADVFPAAVVLGLAGPPLALVAALLPRAARVPSPKLLLGLAALSLAVLPQLLGRTDLTHALYAVPPALVLASLWVTGEGGPARRAVVALLLAAPPLLGLKELRVPSRPEAFPELSRARGVPDDEAAARRVVLAFVASHTQPGEPIFVGAVDHRWIFVNEMDLYFLADRPGGTRTMQFDPGLTNRPDVQAQMASELERSGTRVAVLSSRHNRSFEPNASARPGSPDLDAYLRAHFSIAGVAGPYLLLLRTR